MRYTIDDLNQAVINWWFDYPKRELGEGEYGENGLGPYPEEEREYVDGTEGNPWEDLQWALEYKEDSKTVYLPGVGDVVLVNVRGGGEGDGDDYHIIIRVTGQDSSIRTFKRNGWYASHDGGYLEGPTVEGKIVVKAVEVFE